MKFLALIVLSVLSVNTQANINNYIGEYRIEVDFDGQIDSHKLLIQSIDRKIPIEDIARSKGKSVDEILAEIENIVLSGTRVNLDYYINQEIDEEDQEEVFEFFMEAETDDVEDALEEFEEAFSEEEMRLLRIKFLSEVAN